MTRNIKLQQTVLMVALAAIYPVQAEAASAGVAQFIAGDVNVRRADGKTDPLVKGRDIDSGQAILTGINGRAQVKFSDGGLISLQPNTEFKIANYVDQADPKQDRFLVDLLRGSMRAITGLIGKRNHDNYKVTTNTATIGIRGSGFNAGYNPDGSLGVTTELDAIEVCNAGGCVGLTAGESVIVRNDKDAPVRTNTRASVPTPGVAQDPIVIGNGVNDEGRSRVIQGDGDGQGQGGPLNGTFTNLQVAATYYKPGSYQPGNLNVPGQVASSATVNSGQLASFTANGNGFPSNPPSTTFTPVTNSSSGYAGSTATNDFIGWGTWAVADKSGQTLNDLHYVYGQPTITMPTSGIATYNLTGQTAVTQYNVSGSAMASGTLTSASFSADFTNSKANLSVVTTIGSFNTGTNQIMISGSTFHYSAGGGGNLYVVDGFFTGTNANRAGLVYTAPSTGAPGSSIMSGAISFQTP